MPRTVLFQYDFSFYVSGGGEDDGGCEDERAAEPCGGPEFVSEQFYPEDGA